MASCGQQLQKAAFKPPASQKNACSYAPRPRLGDSLRGGELVRRGAGPKHQRGTRVTAGTRAAALPRWCCAAPQRALLAVRALIYLLAPKKNIVPHVVLIPCVYHSDLVTGTGSSARTASAQALRHHRDIDSRTSACSTRALESSPIKHWKRNTALYIFALISHSFLCTPFGVLGESFLARAFCAHAVERRISVSRSTVRFSLSGSTVELALQAWPVTRPRACL